MLTQWEGDSVASAWGDLADVDSHQNTHVLKIKKQRASRWVQFMTGDCCVDLQQTAAIESWLTLDTILFRRKWIKAKPENELLNLNRHAKNQQPELKSCLTKLCFYVYLENKV